MNKLREKKKNKLTKYLIGALSLVLIGGLIFFYAYNAEAKKNIFSTIYDLYSAKTTTEFKILEIVPENANDANSEIGYYVSDKYRQPYFIDVSKAKSIKDTDWYLGLSTLRKYGLVKYSGTDTAALNSKVVSDAPIYSDMPAFMQGTPGNGYTLVPDASLELVRGKYTVATNGNYSLLPDYKFEGGVFKKKVLTPVSNNSVSGNTVSGNTVSGNTYEESWEVITLTDDNYAGIGLAGIGLTYTAGTGTLNFEKDAYGEYFGYSTDSYSYIQKNASNNYFYNGDWFKEYVFGDKALTKNISITTKKASEVTAADINLYNLVYISGTSQAFTSAGQDLSADVVKQIFNNAAIDHTTEHKAVIMDYKAYSGSATSNIDKLAILMWQEKQSKVGISVSDNGISGNEVETPKTGFLADGKIDTIATVLSDTTLLNTLKSTIMTGASGNFVAGNMFVYDHNIALFDESKLKVSVGDWFATGDFASKYKDTVIAAGFSNVSAMITMNNANNPSKPMATAVTPAVAVQYILAYDGTNLSLIKSSLRILEIQPVKAFLYNTFNESVQYNNCSATVKTNRDTFIKNYIDPKIVTNSMQGQVTFNSMTIDQFIATNENLVEEYDMIYIGSNHYALDGQSPTTGKDYYYSLQKKTVSLYSKTNTPAVVNAYIPTYNDSAMNGMVYYNIGDTTTIKNTFPGGVDQLLGFLDTESKAKTAGTAPARFSARDLTTEKLLKLKDYLNASYPIIVDGDLMQSQKTGSVFIKKINPTRNGTTPGTNDHGRIDNASNLYQLFNYGLTKNNFVSKSDIDNGIVSLQEISKFINQPKLSLNLSQTPTEYTYTADADGVITARETLQPETVNSKTVYYLDYEFSIANLSINTDASKIYNAHLYVDVNSDGRYSDAEELVDATITNTATGESPIFVGGTVQAYSLYANTVYHLRREVPTDYTGALPWCLKIEDASNPSVSVSKVGYTVVAATKTHLDILQVTRNGTASTLNLQTEMAGNNLYGKYLKNLQDFDLNIRTMTVSDFRTAFTANNNILDNYDMLILGFGDYYTEFNNASDTTVVKMVNAFRSYINKGNPVLMAHDLILFDPMAYQVDQLRDAVGMDRYGVTDDSMLVARTGVGYVPTDAAYSVLRNSGRTVAYAPDSAQNAIIGMTHGYSNTTMIWFNTSNTSGSQTTSWTNRHYLNTSKVNAYAWTAPSYYVEQRNKGQLTTYPYTLPDSFLVASTHNQYFQLDMNSDDDGDGDSDVVVWYTLENASGTTKNQDDANGQLYSVTPGDGGNNYYIYNRGNVTYTGAGHGTMGGTSASKYEAQLFVNTLIAAYQATYQPPAVKLFETNTSVGDGIDTLIIPYDKNIIEGNPVESSIQLNTGGTDYLYKFVNPNVDATAKANGTKLYVRASDPNMVNGVKTIELKYYLKIPDGVTKFTADNGVVLNAVTAPLQLPNGTQVNAVEIPIDVYDADFKNIIADKTKLKSGTVYGIYLPLSYLKTQGEVEIIVEATTTITTKAGTNTLLQKGYAALPITKMDLLKLD